MASARRLRSRVGLIDFLDLGSGPDAHRGWKLAEGRKGREATGRFVSVDLDRRVLLNSKKRLIGQPHHSFRQGDVFEVLKRQRDNSVKVVNDDYFVDFLCSDAGLPHKHVRMHEEDMLREMVAATNNVLEKYSRGIFRVMIPNGRFFVTIHGVFRNLLVRKIKEAGFEIQSEKPLTREEILKGTSVAPKRVLMNEEMMHTSAAEMVGEDNIFLNLLGFDTKPDPKYLFTSIRISCKKPRKKTNK